MHCKWFQIQAPSLFLLWILIIKMKFHFGRILSVDLGLKKTGLAISDELWITIRILENLVPKSRSNDIDYLLRLCLKLEVKFILIGYPLLPKSSHEGMMAKRARGFYETLCLCLPGGLSAFLIDEAYTTFEAGERLKLRKLHLGLLDGESAKILIETFIYDQINQI